ncbi:MAG: hypothetical protein AAFN12_06240 [Cyanobacteria bacterium J06560_2]
MNNAKKLLTKIGMLIALSGTLTACITPTTPLPEDSASGATSNKTISKASSDGLSSETSSAVACELVSESEATSPEPLRAPENTFIFEQFNFRPQEIAIANNTVTLTSDHHIFSLCQTNGVWSITSADASEDSAPYNREQVLTDIADPDYQTIEVEGQSYQYRIRLQAEWLTEERKPSTTDPEAPISAAAESLEIAPEDAVFFELKAPSGELISEQLYTVSEIQAAQIGASLGAPSIADAVTVESNIWFAATASKGEGDGGFASLIQYNTETGSLNVKKPEAIQGDQITSLAITGVADNPPEAADSDTAGADSENEPENSTENEPENSTENEPENDAENEPKNSEQTLDSSAITLWMGTQRSGEGVPYHPANGLVSYQPESEALKMYTITNSPLVGAIPHQVAVEGNSLWVGTGDGACQVSWKTIEKSESWNCWKFTAIATLPSDGVEVFDSFLADGPTATLNQDTVEVLWVNQSTEESEAARTMRYEVVYEPGFEAQLSQGAYRIPNEVAQRAAGGNDIFWPGTHWHWNGKRFERTLDEVGLNLVGGGPYGLVSSNARSGFDFDSRTIRGEFDLLDLTADYTKIRYYSGWIEGDEVEVYPTVLPVEAAADDTKPSPLPEMAAKITTVQGP